jgi:hypothetical protein
MAEKNKSIIESALLDAKRIQEALNANTKEILRTVALEEIDGLVKESLEEDYVEEDAEETDVEVSDDESTEELEDVESSDEEEGEESEEGEELELDDEDSVEGDDLEGGDEFSMSAVALGGDDEVKDMTMASDDEVISVYKKLTGDDEIEVVVDDESGDIHLSVNEPGDFVIKTNDMGSGIDDEVEMDEYSMDESEEIDEVMYEIALDEMVDIEGTKAPVGSEEDNWAGDNLEGGFDEDKPHAKAEGPMVMHEEDEMFEIEYNEGDEEIFEKISVGTSMSVGNRRNPHGPGSIGAPENPKAMNESAIKYNALLTEAKELKGKNEEYKQALKQFRTMLAETVVFNSNLTYVTKLFMEHSTTKEEKQAILKRFDSEATTLKESKRLYKSIVSDLSSRKPMNESIERKLNNEVSSGMSKQLNESTAYIDKETQRIKDLMSRVEKR